MGALCCRGLPLFWRMCLVCLACEVVKLWRGLAGRLRPDMPVDDCGRCLSCFLISECMAAVSVRFVRVESVRVELVLILAGCRLVDLAVERLSLP